MKPKTIVDTQGYTLIEIMVVVSIIGILVAVTGATLSGASKSARDKQRVADVAQLKLSARLYAEENGSYPSAESPICATCSGSFNTFVQNNSGGIEDPRHDSTYFYAVTATDICANQLEKTGAGCCVPMSGAQTECN